jgi:hypothetical protein
MGCAEVSRLALGVDSRIVCSSPWGSAFKGPSKNGAEKFAVAYHGFSGLNKRGCHNSGCSSACRTEGSDCESGDGDEEWVTHGCARLQEPLD